MILIKSISCIKTDADYAEIVHAHPHAMIKAYEDGEEKMMPVDYIKERITGRGYRRPDGELVFIGYSEQAEEVIGLTYEAFTQMENDLTGVNFTLSTLRRSYDKLDLKFEEIAQGVYEAENACFFKRLWWLFAGVNITS